MNTCKHCGKPLGGETVLDTMLRLLRKNPSRNIYLARDGLYYYTYRDMSLPELALTQVQVDEAVKNGLLAPKYEGFYKLADSASRPQP